MIVATTSTTSPDECAGESACAIWNPGAAARWSLLFTPAFGAFIHMRNWQALDQPERAASARRWLYASLGMLMLQIFTSALNARLGTEPLLLHPAGLLFLLVWYVAAARPQTLLVKARYGASYTPTSGGMAWCSAPSWPALRTRSPARCCRCCWSR